MKRSTVNAFTVPALLLAVGALFASGLYLEVVMLAVGVFLGFNMGGEAEEMKGDRGPR